MSSTRILFGIDAYVGPSGQQLLYRLHPDGSPDTTFGTNGLYTRTISGPAYAFAEAPNGRLVSVGSDFSVNPHGLLAWWIAQAGVDDTTVNASASSYSGITPILLDTLYLSDGVVAVGGNYLIKLGTGTGGFAGTFGQGGYVALATAVKLRNVLLDAQGELLVSGIDTAANTLFLARFTPSGQSDSTFVQSVPSGSVNVPLGAQPMNVIMALQTDGSILQAGPVDVGGSQRCAVVRYGKTGQIDSSFGDQGRALVGSAGCSPVKLGVQPDGKIVLDGGNAIARLWP